MNLNELSKVEKEIADLMHYELSTEYDISYEFCLDLAKKIYDKLWWQ